MAFMLQTGRLFLLDLTATVTLIASVTTNGVALTQEVHIAGFVNGQSKTLSYI